MRGGSPQRESGALAGAAAVTAEAVEAVIEEEVMVEGVEAVVAAAVMP